MKALWILLICLLTVYAPLELTKVILVDLELTSAYWGVPVWQFILEVCLIWIMYIVGMTIVYRRLNGNC